MGYVGLDHSRNRDLHEITRTCRHLWTRGVERSHPHAIVSI